MHWWSRLEPTERLSALESAMEDICEVVDGASAEGRTEFDIACLKAIVWGLERHPVSRIGDRIIAQDPAINLSIQVTAGGDMFLDVFRGNHKLVSTLIEAYVIEAAERAARGEE